MVAAAVDRFSVTRRRFRILQCAVAPVTAGAKLTSSRAALERRKQASAAATVFANSRSTAAGCPCPRCATERWRPAASTPTECAASKWAATSAKSGTPRFRTELGRAAEQVKRRRVVASRLGNVCTPTRLKPPLGAGRSRALVGICLNATGDASIAKTLPARCRVIFGRVSAT